MALKVGELYALFTLDTKGTDSALSGVNATLSGIADEIIRIGTLWQSAFTRPIVNGMKDAVKTGIEFGDEMAKSRAKAGIDIDTTEGQRAYQALDDEVRRVAKDSVFTATEMAGAYDKMAMAGWNWQSMVGGLQPIADLAAASGDGLVQASDIVTDAMTAFGYTWENALQQAAGDEEAAIGIFQGMVQHFTDVLAVAATSSNTDVAMMGESFKYAASMAGALGYSVDDVAVALGLMANRGIKASQAGTSMRMLFNNLLNPPNDTAASMMERLGIQLYDDEGMLDFMNVMKQLRSSFADLDGGTVYVEKTAKALDDFTSSGAVTAYEKAMEEAGGAEENIDPQIIEDYNAALEKLMATWTEMSSASQTPEAFNMLQWASEIAGVRGLPGLLAIITSSEEEFNGLAESIANSEGATNSMKNAMLNTTGGALAMLLSSVDVLKLEIEDLVDDKLRGLIDSAKEVVDSFINMDDETQTTLLTIAGIAAGIGPALVGIGSLLKLLPALGSAFSFVASPLGLVTVALGAMAFSAMDADGKVSKAMKDVGDALGIDTEDFKAEDLLDGFLADIGDLSTNPAVTGFVERFSEGLRTAMGALGSITGDIIGYIVSPEGLQNIYTVGVSFGKVMIEGFWTGLWSIGEGITKGLLEALGLQEGVDFLSPSKKKTEEEYENWKTVTLQDYASGAARGMAAAIGSMSGMLDGMSGSEISEMYGLSENVAQAWISSLSAAMEKAAQSDDPAKAFQSAMENVINVFDPTFIEDYFPQFYDSLTRTIDASGFYRYLYESLLDPSQAGGIMESLMPGYSFIKIDPDQVVRSMEESVAQAQAQLEEQAGVYGWSDAFLEKQKEFAKQQIEAYYASFSEAAGDAAGAKDAAAGVSESVASTYDELIKPMLDGADEAAKKTTETVAAIEGTLADGTNKVSDAAHRLEDAAVQEFLVNMSAENGTTIAQSFVDAIAAALGDPGAVMVTASQTAANNVIVTIQGILTAETGNGIGSTFGSAIAAGVSGALSGLMDQINGQLTAPGATITDASARVYGTPAAGATPAAIAAAVRSGLNGVAVNMDGKTVGNIVTPTVSENIAAEAAMRG